MGFESYRQGAFMKRLADLPDQPNMQAAELKTYFDSSPEELRQALNRLCDALGEFSAAAKLGYTASAVSASPLTAFSCSIAATAHSI